MVRPADLEQYLIDLTAAHSQDASVPGPRTPTARRKAADDAGAKLAAKYGV
jgi:hypothetical protein